MKRLQHLREAHGLSRREVAQRAHIDQPTYGKVESGRVLSEVQLARLAIVLGWQGDPARLLEDVEVHARG